MVDLRLEYRGGGAFQTLTRLDFDICAKEFETGQKLRAKITRQRSVKQNEFFHALIEAAWDNQRGGPQLPTWRHLKSWLLIQVGHCEAHRFDPGAITPATAAVLRRMFDTVDFTTDGRSIWMKVAKSVSFRATDGTAMQEVVDRVVTLICTDIVPGVKPDDLLDMARKRAA